MQVRKNIISAPVIGVVAFLCLPAALHGFIGNKQPKFFVRFVATSTVVHLSWSGNQDIYLVELKKESTPFLAKLVDEYPGYGNAIPRSLLVSDGTSRIKVKRDQECDVRYAEMPLRAAPGDRRAIIPVPMTFIPNIYPQVGGDFIVQCFRFVRQ